MIRIGVTGGIGMGKSTAGEILESWGIPVADTDVIARDLVAPGQPALAEIRSKFGDEVVGPDGRLDRHRLAGIVFKDSGARVALEGILHPKIRREWHRRMTEWEAGGIPVAATIIPLLYETAAESEVTAVVCVACSAASQRERLHRRGWPDDEIDRRIAAQLPVEEKMRRSAFVIWTEPPPAEHAGQWKRVLETLRAG